MSYIRGLVTAGRYVGNCRSAEHRRNKRIPLASSDQVTLADLGAQASAKEGRLVISMAEGDPYSGSMSTSTGLILSPEMTVEHHRSIIHVFTRRPASRW